MSTRPDLVGKKLANELVQLRDDTPADEGAVAIGLIELELGGTIDALFADFEANAFASASIGQAHRATTHDGHSVVVKVSTCWDRRGYRQ